jgi:hypothetical protein
VTIRHNTASPAKKKATGSELAWNLGKDALIYYAQFPLPNLRRVNY